MLAFLLLLQAQAPVQRAARTISPEDIRRRIGIIADDSMRGRDTPSPELDKTAQYIAGEYRRLGLKPGGDRGTFIQRYSLDRVKIVPDSSAAFETENITSTPRPLQGRWCCSSAAGCAAPIASGCSIGNPPASYS